MQKRPVNKLLTDQMVNLLGTLDCELMNIQQVLTNHFVGRTARHFVFRISTRNNSYHAGRNQI